MGTGYMGADEPEVVQKGPPPAGFEPTEQSLTNLNVPAAEQQQAVDPPVPATAAPTAKVEPKAGEPAPAAEVKEPAPKIVEKIVEKIIEKYPELNEDQQNILSYIQEGKYRELHKFIDDSVIKNYDTMSHIDVIREGLAKKNPQWTPGDIELELRSEYGKQLEKYDLTKIDKELEPEAYKEAEAHNEKADANRLKLERDSRDYRITLKAGQKEIELPKLTNNTPPAAEPTTAPTQEQLDEAAKNWADMAEQQVSLTDYTFQVGDDKNPEEVVFAVTPEQNTASKENMKKWDGGDMMLRRGWATKNADGTLSFNLLRIAEDEYTLDNTAKMVKSAYTQGVTNGRKAQVAIIKNIDDEQTRQPAAPGVPADAGDAVWG